ncbi:SDR family NAD(P)-dependent oxidoreductase [Tenacibaculum agarivorans]|uniref:SDR family NAD(P)-dependent oxidoreductase n=1 Tax=Tenacibaculum agarivorans TaxID=1908389 RepID=UPI00094B9B81|nr:SDR family oxidoreductase [Tenacibaculum agarivorans]
MNNVALITGASSGLGKEFALLHAERNGDVIIVARRENKLQELKSEIESTYHTQVKIIVKDLTKPNAAQEIYDEVSKENITVNFLINNAGFGGVGKFHERALAQDITMINLNVIALTTLTRLFSPDFVNRNQGKILNVSSTASLLPGPLQAVYYATKAYVTSFSNAIAQELSDTNVTVTNLMPGATATEFGSTSGMDKTNLFDKPASARSVAEAGYKGMLSGKLDVISGLTFSQSLLLKMLPFTPKKMLLKQIHDMQKIK